MEHPRLLLVHDDIEYGMTLATLLRSEGCDVEYYLDPMDALDALDSERDFHFLITRVTFPKWKPNGVSLARMAKLRRSQIRVIFAASLDMREHAEDVGKFIPAPADPAGLVQAVRDELSPPDGEKLAGC